MPNDNWGVGASLLRREDDRHLRGRGEFVADIRLPGTKEVVFLRSPHAHARIRSIAVPPGAERPGLHRRRPAAHASRSASCRTRPAPSRRPGRRSRPTRCAMSARRSPPASRPRRAEAEDLAAAVAVDYEALDAVVDAPPRHAPAAASSSTKAGATISISDRTPRRRRHRGGGARRRDRRHAANIRMNRQSGSPMEGRAVLACRDHRLDEIVVYASTQTPHTVRVAIGRDPRPRRAAAARRRARCRRRLRPQGAALPGGDHPRRAGAASSTIRCAGSRTATSTC